MNDIHPLVSVIIPSYQCGSYVREAVDSVLAQTYPNIEIIVMDDGSRDHTREILEPYAKAGKIQYYYQENRGLSAARNAAIRRSKGAFITLLDADDLFLPEKVEKQVAFFEAHPECGICYGEVLVFYDGNPEALYRGNEYHPSGPETFTYLLGKNAVGCVVMMFRRSVFDKIGYFNEEIVQYVEDWDFTLRAAYAGLGFGFISEPLSRYRIRGNSISHDPKLEIKRRKVTVLIFEQLCARMTSEDRARYRMRRVVLSHRAKLWYAELARFFPPLRWYLGRRQKNMLQPVSS